MKDNKKVTTLIFVMVLGIFLILGGTFAYWQWMTDESQQTLVNVSLKDDAKMYIDFPVETLTNLYPTSDCDPRGTSSWVTEITVDNGTGVLLSPKFKLKVKIQDKNGQSITNVTNPGNSNPNRYYIKYAVTGENESCKNALYTGRFDENTQTVNGSSDWYDSELITLYDNTTKFPIVSGKNGSGVSFYAHPNTQTKQRFKVYVWLDKDYVSVTQGTTSTDTMQDAKITVSWSENSGLEQVKKAAPVGEAIAIYSADDNSLRFYRETNPSSVTEGSTYNGRKVNAVMTGFETSNYAYDEIPWIEVGYYDENEVGCNDEACRYEKIKYDIDTVVFEDYIYPVNTAYWFKGFKIDLIDVTKLDTSNVTNMNQMFSSMDQNDTLLKNIIGIENWDTSNVTSMNNMFYGWWGPEIDLSGWNVCNVTNYDYFTSSSNVKKPYFGANAWCNGGNPGPNYVGDSRGEAVALLVGDHYTPDLIFTRTNTALSAGDTYNTKMIIEVYAGIENSIGAPWRNYYTEYGIQNVTFDDYISPVSTVSWFSDLGQLQSNVIDVTKLDTSNVVDMSYMFANNDYLNIIGIEEWDTSNVTNMREMFKDTDLSKLDLSGWNVCKVLDSTEFSWVLYPGDEWYDDDGMLNVSDPYYGVGNVVMPFFDDPQKCNGGNPA